VRHRMDEPLVCRDDRFLIVRLFCCQPTRSGKKKKDYLSLSQRNTYQLLLGTTSHRNGKTSQKKKVKMGSSGQSFGAYRKIEVIWYHGLLRSDNDKRARQEERSALINDNVQAYG
jgi:hypothetical protein